MEMRTIRVIIFEHLRRDLPEGGPLAAFLPEIDGESVYRALPYRAAVSSTLIASLELARDGVGVSRCI
jgi:hypothetical protein